MRNLFNMVALTATAIVMFYVGKGCKDTDYVEVPSFVIDSTSLKKSWHKIDSLSENIRELEMIITYQQDSMTKIHDDMIRIKKQSAQTLELYKMYKATYNVPQQLVVCDTIIGEYADYRAACEEFVVVSDSIMSHLYTINATQADIIKDQVINMNDINAQYMEAMIAYERTYGDRKKKRNWQKISAVLAALLGVTLLAR